MNLAENILAGQQVLWCAVFVLGLEFILLAAKLKEDKTYLFLGGNIALISMMAGVDIWIIFPSLHESTHTNKFLELWAIAFQIMACAYLLLSLWMTRFLVLRPDLKTSLAHSLILGAFAILFVLDGFFSRAILLEWKEGNFHTTWIYNWMFSPYVVLLFSWIIYHTFRGLQTSSMDTKRTLKFLCYAYFILLFFGLFDLSIFIFQIELRLPIGFVEFGALAMGIAGTFIFTDKMIILSTNQRLAVQKINEIYGAQTSSLPLYLLGVAASRISEEIRSQVTNLSSISQSLHHISLGGPNDEVSRINSTRSSLEKYTTGILEFSTSSQVGELKPTPISSILKVAISKASRNFDGKILVFGEGENLILADHNKLSRAVFEIIKNCIEANAELIKIRLTSGLGRISIGIEDDGHECTSGILPKICLPFFTTRKANGALGLGASIAEGIVRAHGGAFRIYAKRQENGSESGLLVNLLLPKLAEDKSDFDAEKIYGECALITNRTELVSEVLRICGNIGIRLSVVGLTKKEKQPKDSTLARNTLVIIDETFKGILTSKWINGGSTSHRLVYICDAINCIRPLRGVYGMHRQAVMCEEMFMKILA